MLIIKRPANILLRVPAVNEEELELVETCRTLRRTELTEYRTRARCPKPVHPTGCTIVKNGRRIT